MRSKKDKDGALRCVKCDRLMRTGADMYGVELFPANLPEKTFHIHNGSSLCNKKNQGATN